MPKTVGYGTPKTKIIKKSTKPAKAKKVSKKNK
jgi:hypothetical protein